MPEIYVLIQSSMWFSPVNNQVLFFDYHYRHFDNRAMDILIQNHVQTFVINSGNYLNDSSNDNRTNSKLKDIYIRSKSKWNLNYMTIQLSWYHMKTITVKYWDSLKVSPYVTISDRFRKKYFLSLPPLYILSSTQSCDSSQKCFPVKNIYQMKLLSNK